MRTGHDMGNRLQQNSTVRAELPEKHRKRAGITLIETLMALLIFAVFMTGMSKILMAHRHLSDKAREHYAAINIAKNRIELVRTFEFDQVADFIESDTVVDKSGIPDTDGYYRRSTTMSSVSSNLVEVVVTVELKNRETLAFDAQEQLATYFAEYLTEDSAVGAGVAVN